MTLFYTASNSRPYSRGGFISILVSPTHQTPMNQPPILTVACWFFVVYAMFGLIELIGASFIQPFFAVIAFGFIQLVNIGSVILVYWLWEGRATEKSVVNEVRGYNADIKKWIALMILEWVVVVVQMVIWDWRFTNSNPALVEFAIDQNIEGYKYWHNSILTNIALALLHIRYSFRANIAFNMGNSNLVNIETKKNA